MPAIKRIEEIAAKWARVTPGRADDYRAGVEDPSVDWQGPTAAAQDRWSDGVSRAAAEGTFARGVNEAGTDKWRRMTIAKGVPRWPAGVREAEDEYRAGFGPYRDIIERTTLPPRGPRGDPGNIERVRVLAAALHEARVRG